MVAYSFKRRFVEPILSGVKRQTIRADRKRHARPGEAVQLYLGMRTKHCRLLGLGTCEAIVPVQINPCVSVTVGSRYMREWDDLDQFARADGFADGWVEMSDFWLDMHAVGEFSGILIRWSDFRPAA